MKKILLGLMVLSAMAYAKGIPTIDPTTAVETADIRETGVQVITKAKVISSGLIIARANTDTGAITSLVLDHGDIGVADEKLTTTPSFFFIKRANNNERLGRVGHELTVSLDHDGKLKHETYKEDSTAVLNHALTIDFTKVNGLKNVTTTSKTSTKNLTKDDYVIEGSITSTITENQTNFLAGNYVNDALITVTISKSTEGTK